MVKSQRNYHNLQKSENNQNGENSVDRKNFEQEVNISVTEIIISLVEAQLVGKYNQNPQQIFTKATEVRVSESSLNHNNQGVIFEQSRKGNYWIVNIEDITYLVPQANYRFNQFNYDSFRKVFQCFGYKVGETSNFLLLKPAIVSSIPIDKSWELKEIGILQFDLWSTDEESTNNPIASSTIDKQEKFKNESSTIDTINIRLNELEQNYEKIVAWVRKQNTSWDNANERFQKCEIIPNEIDYLRYKIASLENQLEELSEKRIYDTYNLTVRDEEINELKKKIEQISSSDQETYSYAIETQDYNREMSLSPQERQILELYQKDSNREWANSITEVNATDETIENARLGGEDIILKKSRRGNYWIVYQGGFNYLVPRKGIIFNDYSYNTAEILFECRLKQQERTQSFRLLKPGKVYELPEGEQWQLESKGILEFY